MGLHGAIIRTGVIRCIAGVVSVGVGIAALVSNHARGDVARLTRADSRAAWKRHNSAKQHKSADSLQMSAKSGYGSL